MSRTLRRKTFTDWDKKQLHCLYGENSPRVWSRWEFDNYQEYHDIYSKGFHYDGSLKFYVNYNSSRKPYRQVGNRSLRATHHREMKIMHDRYSGGYDDYYHHKDITPFIRNAAWDQW